MTTESIFTHDGDGNLRLRRPEAWDRRVNDLEQRVAELERQMAWLVDALDGRRFAAAIGAQTNPLRDDVTLADLRSDRG